MREKRLQPTRSRWRPCEMLFHSHASCHHNALKTESSPLARQNTARSTGAWVRRVPKTTQLPRPWGARELRIRGGRVLARLNLCDFGLAVKRDRHIQMLLKRRKLFLGKFAHHAFMFFGF